MASLDSAVSLIVASFELAAVRAVTRAANANLPKDGPLGTTRPTAADLGARSSHASACASTPDVEPRRVIRPSPLYGPTFDYYDRFGCVCRTDCRGDVNRPAPAASVDAWVMDGPTPHRRPGPFDAPWRHLPPVHNAAAVVKLNVVRRTVDGVRKGMLIDFYA